LTEKVFHKGAVENSSAKNGKKPFNFGNKPFLICGKPESVLTNSSKFIN
jgi:hypothetical protein